MKKYALILALFMYFSTSAQLKVDTVGCLTYTKGDTIPRQRIPDALLHWILMHSKSPMGWCEMSNSMIAFQDSLRRDSIKIQTMYRKDSISRAVLKALQGSGKCIY